MAGAATRRIVIIGSGFGGLGLAIRLKRAGIETFTILEQAATLGGTWRDNSYPGAACDVPSMLYCLSFEQRTDWPRKWSPQAEIRAYMEDCARQERHPAAHPLRRAGHRRPLRRGHRHLDGAHGGGRGTRRRRPGERRRAAAPPVRPADPRPRDVPRRAVSLRPLEPRLRSHRQARRRDRQRGQRHPVHSADRAAGAAAHDLPAQCQLDDSAWRPRLQRPGEVAVRPRPGPGVGSIAPGSGSWAEMLALSGHAPAPVLQPALHPVCAAAPGGHGRRPDAAPGTDA